MNASVRLSGATVALDDAGDGAAVLLLHGFPATRRLWSAVSPALVELGYRVLVPDLVGYGGSEPEPGVRVDMASQALWMLELLDALGVGQTVVAGHDVGSAAAQLMLVKAAERVRALAVLDGVYRGEWAMEAIASIRSWRTSDAHRLFPVLVRRFGKTATMREMLAAYEGEQGGLRLIRAALDLDPSQTEDIGDALRSSRVPALVLWGERDEFLPIDTVARPLAQLLRTSPVLVRGGHFTPLECPEQVVAALSTFLAQLPQ